MTNPDVPELEARLSAASTPKERIEGLNALAWALRSVEMARAHELAAEARELAQEHGDTLGEARATRTLAMTMLDPSQVVDVFRLGHEAKRLFDEAGDGEGRAASRDFLASILEHTGDLSGAMALALDALSIAREIGHEVRQAYALSNLGGILAASGEVEEGVARLREAFAIFERAGHELGAASIASRLAKIFQRSGDHDQALKYAEYCRRTALAAEQDFLLMNATSVLGSIAEDKGDFAEAERHYRDALAGLIDEPTRGIVAAEPRMALGRLMIRQGRLDEAIAELDGALDEMMDELSIVHQAAAHEALADAREQRGELAAALAHMRTAKKLREQIALNDARSNKAQIEARLKMDAAKKDAEIHKLRFVELHGMQTQLVEAEKMALLGQVAAGTAHELHTPLGVLRSNAKLATTATERLIALLDGESSARAKKLAEVLASCRDTNRQALERIADIADSFGRFSELDQAERRDFDVREGVDGALAVLTPTLRDEITVERNFDEVPSIAGWPREINLALLTVLQNAIDAIDGAGTLTVATRVADERVTVSVRDTGRGMTEEQVAHLFDVAWAEDGTRVKMRLGLSAAYATMQKHGGSLLVESAVSKGTTVTFRFQQSSGMRTKSSASSA